MKLFFFALLLICSVKITTAQQQLLSLDEHNKYIYYQVVDMPGLSADTLKGRGTYFFKKDYPKIKPITDAGKVIINGKFATYSSGGLVVKHENGQMAYQLTIECKDGKYRYWLTDFVFTPNERDRYGNYVPQPGIEIPLEKAAEKLLKKEADSYLVQTGTFCKLLGDRLKLYMINAAPKKEEPIKKVVTDKW